MGVEKKRSWEYDTKEVGSKKIAQRRAVVESQRAKPT